MNNLLYRKTLNKHVDNVVFSLRKTQSLIYLAVSSDYLVNIAFVRRIIRYDSKLYNKMYTGMIEFSVYWDGRYGWKGNEGRL